MWKLVYSYCDFQGVQCKHQYSGFSFRKPLDLYHAEKFPDIAIGVNGEDIESSHRNTQSLQQVRLKYFIINNISLSL